ncbi:non-secretory ribonuclease [Saccopteryx bilineata]|uniref:non-secretory ribonuclease n=1 Tax=Saccopteryx bilineata TaxID=59482 RepID=UPI00339071EA
MAATGQRLGHTVPTQRDSQLCLLLLLGLLGTVIAVHAPPPGLNWAQWFEVQHMNMTNNICTIAMRVINRLNYVHFQKPCKRQNTFLNTTSLAAVTNLCNTPNITCRNGIDTNCHRSSAAVNLTYCNITGPSLPYMQCQYQQVFVPRNYTIACNRRGVPIHFDGL